MASRIRFTVPGEPMSKQRPRMTRTGHTYTPQQTVVYENLVKMAYLALKDNYFWDCTPLEVHIIASFAIPKSYSKVKIKKCLQGELAPSTKDLDNIAKIICDALNGIAYSDDKHICRLIVEKIFVVDPADAGVSVELLDYKK